MIIAKNGSLVKTGCKEQEDMERNDVPKLGPPPPASSPAASATMKANRAKDTGPELRMRTALRAAGLGGYRLAWKNAPGRPDISYPGKHVAIFIHGCYWHRCPICDKPLPKNNADFWQRKFIRNQERDARKTRDLEEAGWRVVQLWECQIKNDIRACVSAVRDTLERVDKTYDLA
jgi:DNA mismatch endonuclease (patch repair protein)